MFGRYSPLWNAFVLSREKLNCTIHTVHSQSMVEYPDCQAYPCLSISWNAWCYMNEALYRNQAYNNLSNPIFSFPALTGRIPYELWKYMESCQNYKCRFGQVKSLPYPIAWLMEVHVAPHHHELPQWTAL